MTGRTALYILLGIVGAAAAVISFAGLRDLAELVHFTGRLAPLLPVVLDAGAAAGSLVWLGVVRLDGAGGDRAKEFARALVLALLTASVGGNALGHALAAYAVRPAWWLIALVSALAPAALGAVVHLAVLVERAIAAQAPPAAARSAQPSPGLLDALAEQLIGADWDELMRTWRQTRSDAAGAPGSPGREVPLPAPPDRAELNDVLAADLRASNVARRAKGYDDLNQDQVRDRYGVGATRAGKLRSLAATPPGPPVGDEAPPVRPHLVPSRKEESA